MKTLDEVIEILEKVVKHDYVWFDEKTALMTIETLTETLQYLRELRDMTDIPMEYFEYGGTSQELRKTSQFSCPKCHSEFVILPEANNPLTWDELKQMEGKPVWVEYLRDGATYDAEWCIVKDIDDDLLHDTEGYGYGRANKYGDGYGVGWQAYRKERKA